MHPLEVYYLNQAGSVPSTPPRSTFSEDTGSAIFRQSLSLGPLTPLRGAKTVGLETLRTDGKILTDIAELNSTDNAPSAGDIVSKHETESAQNFICKL